jgi:hypothetical protein
MWVNFQMESTLCLVSLAAPDPAQVAAGRQVDVLVLQHGAVALHGADGDLQAASHILLRGHGALLHRFVQQTL